MKTAKKQREKPRKVLGEFTILGLFWEIEFKRPKCAVIFYLAVFLEQINTSKSLYCL
jgi:hypothetical protein